LSPHYFHAFHKTRTTQLSSFVLSLFLPTSSLRLLLHPILTDNRTSASFSSPKSGKPTHYTTLLSFLSNPQRFIFYRDLIKSLFFFFRADPEQDVSRSAKTLHRSTPLSTLLLKNSNYLHVLATHRK
jgi:hypothetical protein